jgi:hypothetical protein
MVDEEKTQQRIGTGEETGTGVVVLSMKDRYAAAAGGGNEDKRTFTATGFPAAG